MTVIGGLLQYCPYGGTARTGERLAMTGIGIAMWFTLGGGITKKVMLTLKKLPFRGAFFYSLFSKIFSTSSLPDFGKPLNTADSEDDSLIFSTSFSFLSMTFLPPG